MPSFAPRDLQEGDVIHCLNENDRPIVRTFLRWEKVPTLDRVKMRFHRILCAITMAKRREHPIFFPDMDEPLDPMTVVRPGVGIVCPVQEASVD
ncbi:hypothetical protein EON81_17385 [bacterium]|nr:MAG: hypothetical protein EON81_17385 [bacterium]